MLPQDSREVFRDTSFFTRHTSLPTPTEIRAKAQESQHRSPKDDRRPPPVTFPELNLLVKYGAEITIAEGQCLWAIRRILHGAVPVPEVYGWDTDNGQVFIYMELIHGVTLEDRYDSLIAAEKTAIAQQLKGYIDSLRTLTQDPADHFVGKCVPYVPYLPNFNLSRSYWATASPRNHAR